MEQGRQGSRLVACERTGELNSEGGVGFGMYFNRGLTRFADEGEYEVRKRDQG